MTMSYELQELRNVFHGLETVYSTYLPKVDPVLIHNLLLREEQNSSQSIISCYKFLASVN